MMGVKKEIEFELDGETYTVEPTFGFIDRVEERYDLVTFSESMSRYHAKIKDIAWCLYCALREAGYKVTYNEIGEKCIKDLQNASRATMDILYAALNVGPEKTVKSDDSKKKAGKSEQQNTTE